MKKLAVICFLMAGLGINAWAASFNYGLLNTGVSSDGTPLAGYSTQSRYTVSGSGIWHYSDYDDHYIDETQVANNAFVIAGTDFSEMINPYDPDYAIFNYVPNTIDAQWISPLNPGFHGFESIPGAFENASGFVTFSLLVNVLEEQKLHVDFAGSDHVEFFLNNTLISVTEDHSSLKGVDIILQSGNNDIQFLVTNSSKINMLFVRSSEPVTPVPDAGSTLLMLGCAAVGLGLAKRK